MAIAPLGTPSTGYGTFIGGAAALTPVAQRLFATLGGKLKLDVTFSAGTLFPSIPWRAGPVDATAGTCATALAEGKRTEEAERAGSRIPETLRILSRIRLRSRP